MKQRNIIYNDIGNRIIKFRKKSGYSQEQVGGALGLSRTSIANIEAGRQHFMVDTLLMFCAVFNCKTKDLLPEIPEIEVKEFLKKETKEIQYKTMEANFKW